MSTHVLVALSLFGVGAAFILGGVIVEARDSRLRRRAAPVPIAASPAIGFVVMGPYTLNIERILIRHGFLYVLARRDGPCGGFTGCATLFGVDGIGFLQTPEPFTLPAVTGYVTVELPIRLGWVESSPDKAPCLRLC